MRVLVFNPDNLVPLSVFTVLDGDQEPANIAVHPAILNYVLRSGGKLSIVRSLNGAVSIEEADAFDVEAGTVAVKVGDGGTVAVVSELLRNEFPIATHWDASLHEGRGGPREGASDAIGELRVEMGEGDGTESGAGIVTSSLEMRDDLPESPYAFDTERLGLLIERPGESLRRAPGFDRYIGDVYSLYGVSEEVALLLSAEALKMTGYPVMFRNAGGDGEGPVSGLPVFQLFNNHVIRDAEGIGSLASFIVPPGWSEDRSGGYSCLFTGYYDQNENVYRHCGLPTIKAIGKAMELTGQGSVGIVWNGGGSIGTRTQHPSAFGQLNLLFRLAADRYAVNPHRIVTVGGSRGGLTALLAACNPLAEGYRVQYALCYGVPFSLYGPAADLLNVSYPARWEAICSDMGLKHAWRPGWRDEEGRNAVERYWLNTFGTADEERIAAELHPQSERLLDALKERGTRVWLNSSTHDPFTSFAPALEWLRRARAYGIPVRHEIGYRHGHNNSTDLYEAAVRCLAAIASGEEAVSDETVHYRRTGEGTDEWTRTESFAAERQPVFFEGPKLAVAGLTAALSVYGPSGTGYRLAIRPAVRGGVEEADANASASASEGVDLGAGTRMDSNAGADAPEADELVLMEGVLPELEGSSTCSYASATWEVPGSLAGSAYLYELTYCHDLSAGDWIVVPPVNVPHPGTDRPRRPELTITAEVPDFTGPVWFEATMVHFIGWGLSEV